VKTDRRPWFVVASLAVHLSVFFALQARALRPEPPKRKNVELAIVKPPPRVEELPPPKEPEPKKKPLDLTKRVEKAPAPAAPPPEAPKAAEPPPPPVFGLSMSSVTDNPGGPQMRVGNTTLTEPGQKVAPKDVKPLSGDGTSGRAPVSLAQVSKQPQRVGECPPFDPRELYSKEALEREVEGQVTLEVVIDESGKVGEVKVLKGLGFGLDEIAASTMRKHCRFEAAEMGGEKVPTRIRYNFTFVLPE
jgi:TonB family protein